MHSVEALLAAADATGDEVWVDHAVQIVERLILGEARSHAGTSPNTTTSTGGSCPTTTGNSPGMPSVPMA